MVERRKKMLEEQAAYWGGQSLDQVLGGAPKSK